MNLMGEPPAKRAKLLDDSGSEESSDNDSGGVTLNIQEPAFKVNEEYARRFEHNQRRAELHRLEEKFGSSKLSKASGEDIDEEAGSSSDEEEDDDGVLASGALDDEVNATLKALRSKDPRVYDKSTTFYTTREDDDVANGATNQEKATEKPLHLRDYHREALLRGDRELEDPAIQPTYAQEQDNLRKSVVHEMHAAVDGESGSSDSDGDDDGTNGFLTKKAIPQRDTKPRERPSLRSEDVDTADKDPEGFLSKFLESRAWVAPSGAPLHPFESDDDEEDDRAEQFEQAYNLRFENPQGANEKLVSHARDTAAKFSVRQEPDNKRKRARDAERLKKEEARREVADEKSRLRKLRLEEAEKKIKRIKEAAGLGKRPLQVEEWQDFLTEDWDDHRWEIEMKQRFGDDYYAEDENIGSDDGDTQRKVKKPKWNDDIDIKDLVPDFDEEDDAKFSLSEDESVTEGKTSNSKKSKKKKQEKEEQKRESRKERRKVERLVDEKLDVDFALNGTGTNGEISRFKYRETSPGAFGLTAKDILLASDSQLNQYAGLKKMAAFRDAEKKRKDKKRLGKKARLRQWRKDTFGDEDGSRKTLQDILREAQDDGIPETSASNALGSEANIKEGKRRKRSKKSKAAVS